MGTFIVNIFRELRPEFDCAKSLQYFAYVNYGNDDVCGCVGNVS